MDSNINSEVGLIIAYRCTFGEKCHQTVSPFRAPIRAKQWWRERKISRETNISIKNNQHVILNRWVDLSNICRQVGTYVLTFVSVVVKRIHAASSDTSVNARTQVCRERAEWGRFQNPHSAPICGDFQKSPFRVLPIDFYILLVESVLSYGWYSSYTRRRRMGRGMGTTVWSGLTNPKAIHFGNVGMKIRGDQTWT